MSLVAFAARVAVVRVLRAALPSAFIVVDSPVDPIANLETSPASALIAVYAGQGENKLDGEAFFAGEPRLNLDMQVFLPQQMAFSYLDAHGAPQTLTLDTRGAGSETALDLVERMIARALAVRDDAWSDLFGRFILTVRQVISSSYLVETAKVKAPAREIRMVCETLQEPVPGAAMSEVWTALLTAMQADEGSDSVAGLAPWIAAEIASPAGLSQTEVDRIFLGLSRYSMQAIGLGMIGRLDPTVSLPDVVMTQGTLDDSTLGAIDPSTMLVDGVAQSFEDPPGDTQNAKPPRLIIP
jgi:hypothetical protein